MGTISTGVGLVSGLDHESLIQSLMQVERRAVDQVKTRIAGLDTKKAAYLDLSARLSSLMSRFNALSSPSMFRASKATSSNPDILTATSRSGALPGAYQFSVRGLASTYHAISRGFESAGATLSPATLTLESALARVDRAVDLSALNGFAGVQRGSIKITNRAGSSATVDLTDALTIQDVADKINAAGVSVTASIKSDRLALTDNSTGSGAFRIDEVSGGRTAADLGFGAGYNVDADNDGALSGATLLALSTLAPLTSLNDGVGVRRAVAGNDFTIGTDNATFAVDLSDIVKPDTRLGRLNDGQGVRLGVVKINTRDGLSTTVDLTGAKNLGQIESALEAAFDGKKISVTLTGGRLVVNDSSNPPEGQTAAAFSITDVSGYTAADLGLTATANAGKIDGRDVLKVDTLADVLAAINEATGNTAADGSRRVTAALSADKQRLVFTSTDGEITFTTGASKALADLGLRDGRLGVSVNGTRLIGGLNTVMLKTLRGGQGVETGVIRISSGNKTVDVDLRSAETLSDAIDLLRNSAATAGLAITVGTDTRGTRLTIAGNAGASVTVSDVSGSFADQLGLDQTAAVINSDNLQRQYLSESTRLSTLSNGRGVSLGSIRITNSNGVTKTADLSALKAQTLGDVIEAINGLSMGVTARINDTGDGLLVTDTAGGGATMKIEEDGGTAARDLNILGNATNGKIDGSFEFKIQIGGGDSITTIASRISEKSTLASGTVLNDGSGLAPYRLSIVSRASGQIGDLILDDGGAGLIFSTLTTGRDARLIYGGSTGGVLLTSSTNTFSGTLNGVTLNATGVSDSPVTVSVETDVSAIKDTLEQLVNAFNDTFARITDLGKYDPETQTRGVLMGESTLRSLESRLQRMVSRVYAGTGSTLNRLSQIGIKTGSGGTLTFDPEAFETAYNANPEAVTKFFTEETNGVAQVLKKELEGLTKSSGILETRSNTLGSQRELLDRRTTALEELLSRKESRLRRQFEMMESALSQLQAQQSQLSNFASSLSQTAAG